MIQSPLNHRARRAQAQGPLIYWGPAREPRFYEVPGWGPGGMKNSPNEYLYYIHYLFHTKPTSIVTTINIVIIFIPYASCLITSF